MDRLLLRVLNPLKKPRGLRYPKVWRWDVSIRVWCLGIRVWASKPTAVMIEDKSKYHDSRPHVGTLNNSSGFLNRFNLEVWHPPPYVTVGPPLLPR